MRKPIAMLIVCLFMAGYAALAATIGTMLVEKSRILQLLFFAVAGVLWVFPLKPLMDWMKAGDKKADS
jgi:predicted membrane channel-forming protein YqfA (hemolysin III family)